MIRRALLGPIARLFRPRARGTALEAPLEYVLFLAGWLIWPLDAVLRLLAATAGARPGTIRAEIRILTRHSESSAREGALACLRHADALLSRVGIDLRITTLEVMPWPREVAPPVGGLGALTGGFFPWASSRAPFAPTLTIYFVDDLGPLAGCAVPGADWVVVERGTDGTTIVHEIGHLADLWTHTNDPHNVMTDRPGGRHDEITLFQQRLLQTCPFVTSSSCRSVETNK